MLNSVSLATLLSPWFDCPQVADIEVHALQLDSRQVKHGETFVAIVGHTVDGRQFIDRAIEQGANAVIAQACERHPSASVRHQHGVAIVYIDKLDEKLSQLAGRLYTHPSMSLIGVTGTNGKTTITQLIAQWLDLIGQKAAVMGTTGNGFLASLTPAANTTGNAIEIQKTLAELQQQGATATALEVSSHGLVQGRVKALQFAAGVFSNLSRDHLDYHGTMDAYAQAKLTLFTEHDRQQAILNLDDQVGAQWYQTLQGAIGVSLSPYQGDGKVVWARSVAYAESGIKIEYDGCFGSGCLNAPLIGEFNATNLLLAMTTLLALGADKQALLDSAPLLRPVLGRMELFQVANKAKVVVDYAHTPDALEKALQALRVHCTGSLWAIFGCGGDRDRGKRPMMAEIAERLADHVILTDDNPRSEDPALIVQEMLAGCTRADKAVIEHDRFKALQYALDHAQVDDIILLAGKGHEDYQVLKQETVHYSDREAAQQLLGIAL